MWVAGLNLLVILKSLCINGPRRWGTFVLLSQETPRSDIVSRVITTGPCLYQTLITWPIIKACILSVNFRVRWAEERRSDSLLQAWMRLFQYAGSTNWSLISAPRRWVMSEISRDDRRTNLDGLLVISIRVFVKHVDIRVRLHTFFSRLNRFLRHASLINIV